MPKLHIGFRIFLPAAIAGLGLAATMHAYNSSTHFTRNNPPDFLAEGFGNQTTGGSGGRLVEITSLKDHGRGSLRWALETLQGPRIVTFDVEGTIALADQIEIQGDVTVDGTTAPGIVTITGARLRVVDDNVILRGLRIRPGDGPGMKKESRDGISIGKSGKTVKNVVIDGNSITWGVDENLSIWGDVENVTISNNIIAQALDQAGHPKGRHSMGLLVGGGEVSRVTIKGNLLAHNRQRNPTIKDRAREIEFINNLVYNWGPNGLQADGVTLHAIGNTYIPGPDTVRRPAIRLEESDLTGQYYMADNIAEINYPQLVQSSPVFESSKVSLISSAKVKEQVLDRAGARTPSMDAVDIRIIEDVLTGTGAIIDSPSQMNLP